MTTGWRKWLKDGGTLLLGALLGAGLGAVSMGLVLGLRWGWTRWKGREAPSIAQAHAREAPVVEYWMWEETPLRGKGVPVGKEPEVELAPEGHVLPLPKLRLKGPWRDGLRRYPGGAELVEPQTPGFCLPGIRQLMLQFYMGSPMGIGDAWAVIDNPELLRTFQSEYWSYFDEPEFDIHAPLAEAVGPPTS